MVRGAEQAVGVEMGHPLGASVFVFVALSGHVCEQVQRPANGQHGEYLDGDSYRVLEKESTSTESNRIEGGGIA